MLPPSFRRACALAAALVLGAGPPATAASAQEPGPPSSPPSTTTTAPAATSATATPGPRAELKVSASVPDGPFVPGDEVPLTVTITNAGGADATGVVIYAFNPGDDFSFSTPRQAWGEFEPTGPGATIPAGESRVLEATGTIGWTGGEPAIRVIAEVAEPRESASTEVPVPMLPLGTTGTVGGLVFGDTDGDGTADPGEGLAGVRIDLYAPDGTAFGTTTGGDGRFSFTEVPAAVYSLSTGGVPGGWVLDRVPDLRVDGTGKHTGLRVRGARPLSEALSATIEFTEKTYRPGDEPHLRVTLSNHGAGDVTGVKAACDRPGEGPHLRGWHDPARWGDLAGPGVTIAAGATRTWTVSGTLPASADDHGRVFVHCDFGPDPGYGRGYPDAFAQAKVPGRTGSSWGHVYHDQDGDERQDDGEGPEGVRVGIVDPGTGDVVARTTTGENGRIDFEDAPVGLYRLQTFGPWSVVDPDNAFVAITTDAYPRSGWGHRIEPGPDQPDTGNVGPDPVTEAPPLPAPGDRDATGGGAEGLASTGVNAVTMSAAGLAVLLAGAAALVLARRRRQAA